MTQTEVLDYVLDNDCYVYEQRIKEDGIHYFVRRNGTKKMVVIYPVKDNKSYTKPAVCHVCQTLDINQPDYAKDYVKIVNEAKTKAKTLSEFNADKRSMN